MENKLKNQISSLYNEYKDDEYLLNKLNNYIINELPQYLNLQKKLHGERNERKNRLTDHQDKFINNFLTQNLYFFSPASEIFFYYNNIDYTIIKEDTIIHNILNLLNKEQNLLDWKFKTKISIIKTIKDNNILSSIPESLTIQNVLKLFSNYFENENEIKHFFIVIGDIILKKNTNIYLININFKPLLRLLEFSISHLIGQCLITSHFKFKYHEQSYKDLRIITGKNTSTYELDEINKNILNIIVVSCYYSSRYKSSDNFLLTEELINEDFAKKILILKNNTPETLVKKFIDDKIIINNGSNITIKNMVYLWKQYIEEKNLPNVVFNSTLKSIIKTYINFNDESESFENCTSKNLPLVQKFLQFWEENIKEDQNEYYIEISEIIYFFKLQFKIIPSSESIKSLIKHFFPDTNIENNFIYGLTFSKYSKREIIWEFINSGVEENLTFKAFVEYCTNNNKLIIGKQYFDLYIKSNSLLFK